MSDIAGSMEIDFAGHALRLLPDRAVWWAAESSVLVADVHLGKAAAFRSTGLPVPSGATNKDLSRLTRILEQTAAKQLIIIGDFFHARRGRNDDIAAAIARWRETHRDVNVQLIRGNHDLASGCCPAEWDIEEIDGQATIDGVALSHHPDPECELPLIAGHVHPYVWLRDFDGSMVSWPCFVFESRAAILPAFGSFTGGYRLSNEPGRRIFLPVNGRVVAAAR